MTATLRSLALFCRVVDNFGDIGICYRLARQMVREQGLAVTLWVDDLASFQRMCPSLDTTTVEQSVDGIRVVHWRDQSGEFTPDQIADIVIEFFGCDLPPGYIAAMQQTTPVWINLEGLSAEEWVEGCHMLTSPRFGMTKYFFYPGFTAHTGGLLREAGLIAERNRFVADPAQRRQFLRELGVADDEQQGLKVSLFCYPHAPLEGLLGAWQKHSSAVTCLVPQGVATRQVDALLGTAQVAVHGALTLRRIPFLPQQAYDRLLWSCDINMVRGEDSFVRAQWASAPFVWHIYPQDDDLHHTKLRAWLQRSTMRADSLSRMWLAWNDVEPSTPDWSSIWRDFAEDREKIANMAPEWQQKLLANGDLATNLMVFARSVGPKKA